MKTLFLENDIHPTHSVVQLNLTVSNFSKPKEFTYNIFEYEEDIKKRELTNKLQSLRDKYGVDIIKTASELKEKLTNKDDIIKKR